VANVDSLVLMTPGLITGVLLVLSSRAHPAVLPCAIFAIPLLFYIVLWSSGKTPDDARAAYGNGWLDHTEPHEKFWELWDIYKFPEIQWWVFSLLSLSLSWMVSLVLVGSRPTALRARVCTLFRYITASAAPQRQHALSICSFRLS